MYIAHLEGRLYCMVALRSSAGISRLLSMRSYTVPRTYMGTRLVQGWYMPEYGAVQSTYFLVLGVATVNACGAYGI